VKKKKTASCSTIRRGKKKKKGGNSSDKEGWEKISLRKGEGGNRRKGNGMNLDKKKTICPVQRKGGGKSRLSSKKGNC